MRARAIASLFLIAALVAPPSLTPASAARKSRGPQQDTQIDLNYAKRQKRVRVTGRLSPTIPQAEIDIVLAKRKQGGFKTVATRSPVVDAEGRFSTRLARPNNGKCRVTASYEGDATHEPSSADRTFQCGLPVHMIAYSPEQLPGRTEKAVEKINGVKATTAMSGSLFLKSSRTRSGTTVDNPPGNYRISLDVSFINPDEYARFAKKKDRDLIRSLRKRRVVFSKGETELREGHEKLKMRTTVGRFKSIGAVSNASAQGYEVLVPKPAPNSSVAFRTVLIENRLMCRASASQGK